MAETESPIEDMFLNAVRERVHPSVALTPQVPVVTRCGAFRLDFLFQTKAARIAIECDGREFHDRLGWRDEWRDFVTLSCGVVDEVFRFRGQDLVHRMDDCLFLLRHFHPELFSERGGHITERLGSDEVRNQADGRRSWAPFVNIHYPPKDGFPMTILAAIHRTRQTVADDRHAELILGLIERTGARNLDEARNEFERAFPW